MSEKLLTAINDTFNPWQPLPAGDPLYVDCQKVRGDANIISSLGRSILLTSNYKCHLYAGHRGNGKSTELLRLKKHLEDKGCFVVYFDAEEADIDTIDTQYTDILLSCTKHLTLAIKDAYSQPILDWLKARWASIKDFLDTDVELENLRIEQQIEQIGKVTASLKFNPSQRAQIRQQIEPHVKSLRDALNEFIRDAKQKLPAGKDKLVVIVDSLDRIVPVLRNDSKTNHHEIFIDRADQLRSLECSIVYTVPISLVHSSGINDLSSVYDSGSTKILPMIMVRDRNGKINPEGLAQMQQIISERMKKCDPNLKLVPDIFESQDLLENICVMTGGYVRALMLLVQSLINEIDTLPITEKVVRRCFSYLRNERHIAIEEKYEILAQTAITKQIKSDNDHRKLLFNRCILQYAYVDDENQVQTWYDIDPLIVGILQFQAAMKEIGSQDRG